MLSKPVPSAVFGSDRGAFDPETADTKEKQQGADACGPGRKDLNSSRTPLFLSDSETETGSGKSG
jgi:hypothetical protein